MDALTKLVKYEIKLQYRSVRQFAMHVGIPQTTLISALSTSIGNTSFSTVVKVCSALHITSLLTDTSLLYDDDKLALLSRYQELDDKGKHAVDMLIKLELERHYDDDTGYAAAFSGKSIKNTINKKEQIAAIDALRDIDK